VPMLTPVIPFRYTEVAHAAMPGSQLSVFPAWAYKPSGR
jgi:hypothetical protein